jgi:hypothetical protein
MSDPDVVRQRTLIGWMFDPLTPEDRNRVKAYLMDGDPTHLAGTRYEERRRQVVADPAAPLSAEELLKLVPGAAEVKGPEVKMFDSESAQFFLIVGPNHEVHLQSKMTPEETLEMLHALMHDVQATIQRRDSGLN